MKKMEGRGGKTVQCRRWKERVGRQYNVEDRRRGWEDCTM